MNLIFIAFAAWLVLRCYHPYPPSSQPHLHPNIAATYAPTSKWGAPIAVNTHIHTRANPTVSLSLPPSLTHHPPFSFSSCLSLSPITLPVLVFDLQTLVGIMTTNQGWRWVITMWPTHPSWPFYSLHMMHLSDSFVEPAELHQWGGFHAKFTGTLIKLNEVFKGQTPKTFLEVLGVKNDKFYCLFLCSFLKTMF